jgi:outer membrane protein assembly factor BamA
MGTFRSAEIPEAWMRWTKSSYARLADVRDGGRKLKEIEGRPVMQRPVCFLSGLVVFLLGLAPVEAQFKVEPKADVFGFEDEPRREFYSPVRYNRVEGFFAAFGVTVRNRKNGPLSLSADAGYGLASKRWGYNVSLEWKLPFPAHTRLGGTLFRDLGSDDGWIMGRLENSFAAAIFGEDFLDYYWQEGAKIWIQKAFGEKFHLRAEFSAASYSTARTNASWHLLGKNKTFRSNPPVQNGRENRLRIEWIIDELDNPIFPVQGWYMEGALEKGGGFLGGDSDLANTGLFVTIKFFQPTVGNQRFIFTGRFGKRWDSTDLRHLMTLGGVGSLRGYRDRELKYGNNLVFGRFEYALGGDLLQKIPLQRIPFFSSLGLTLFYEVGALWNRFDGQPPGAPYYASEKREWKSDVGVSLSVTGDFLRVDFAHRLDGYGDPWRVTFRVLPKW